MESSKFLAFYCKKNALRGRTDAIPWGNMCFISKNQGAAPANRCAALKAAVHAA